MSVGLKNVPEKVSDLPAFFDELLVVYKRAIAARDADVASGAQAALSSLAEAEAALLRLDAAENIITARQ